MTDAHEHREYITKTQLIAWAAAAIVSLVLMMWTLHSQQVSNAVYQQAIMNEAEWRDEQRREMTEIKDYVDDIRRIVMDQHKR